MITIKNVQTIQGETVDHVIDSPYHEDTIDATGLTMLPALIDPHVHFRVPGGEYKEDWQTGARAAIAGGVTTVLDMPNNQPSCTSKKRIYEKMMYIDEQLKEASIPLRHHLYIGATEENLKEIEQAKNNFVAVKIFLGQSTGDLLMRDMEIFEKMCQMAAQLDILLAIHAEDDAVLKENEQKLKKEKHNLEVADHSRVRSRNAALTALENALKMCRKYKCHMYILHTSTKEELKIIRQAKADELPVHCEITPHHLFLNEGDYTRLGTKAQMNPPLRTEEDNEALWEGIHDGTVDVIGTDHAPHTLEEKQKPYREAPSGVPGIENYLALLLDAHSKGKITLEEIARLTHDNPQTIFGLQTNDDIVLVGLNKSKTIIDNNQKTKCGWSPYAGMSLTGWPVYTILKGNVYKI